MVHIRHYYTKLLVMGNRSLSEGFSWKAENFEHAYISNSWKYSNIDYTVFMETIVTDASFK